MPLHGELKNKRDALVVQAWHDGLLLSEIAKALRITYQRVGQILREQGIDCSDTPGRTKRIRAKRREDRLSAAKAGIEKDRAAGLTMRQLTERYGVSHKMLRKVITVEQITDEQLLEALRAVRERFGYRPTYANWDLYRSEHPKLPTRETVSRRFGSWSAALEAAGMSFEDAMDATRGPGNGWSDDVLVEALRECANDLGKSPTIDDYKAWRDGRAEFPKDRVFMWGGRTWNGMKRLAGLAPCSRHPRTKSRYSGAPLTS